MAKQLQASLTGGEISPSLFARVDLARFATSLATCRNSFVRPTGGVSNRAGLQFVYALDPDSLATLIPFVFSTTQSYMLVFQEETIKVYTNGAYVENVSTLTITNVVAYFIPGLFVVTTSAPHGLSNGDPIDISGIVGTGDFSNLNDASAVAGVINTTDFLISDSNNVVTSGTYSSGGSVVAPFIIETPYLSEDLASLRYTQSADVVTIVNHFFTPYEFVRIAAASFTFAAIDDFEGGPFLNDNVTATTVTASAETGTGITITASSAIFTADHVGAFFRITKEDLSAIPPWEPDKHIAATGVDPDGLRRQSNGKVYQASGNSAAPSAGTFTGTVAPKHEEGVESDGDGGLRNGTANTRAGVSWLYLHSLFGIARITAIGGGGTTATADVMDFMPVLSPETSAIWAFGAWNEDQGYPALVTYYQDRLVFANTPGAPQTEWASKTADYHNFSKSSPLVPNDSITQPLNARQINAIVELVPMEQLIALTSSSSWASPKRGEAWTPLTIGYDPQSFDGAAFLRSILTGESCLFAQDGATKIRDLAFKTENDKFRGDELTILARHLFGPDKYIVDMDYAKEPHGILWIVRSDGALIGLTYLREQEVIGWHRHDTDGFFERVCVIPESGVDTPYFVVRRTVGGATVRYLERMAVRDRDDILDSFFVDSGLSYDGRNTTATTITISGASYDGGDTVTLTASAGIFASTDVDSDAIQFPFEYEDGDETITGTVRVNISAFTSATVVSGVLQSPVPAILQAVATTTWTFARDTFSGLSHLEGCTVAILADGSPEVQQVVSDGEITLAYPAGVVHIGLPYVSDIETLDVNIFNSNDPTRDRSKLIPKVAVMVEKTLGLQGGADEDSLHDLGLQPADFDYSSPWETQSEIQIGHLVTNYNKKGCVLLRQSNPLPMTVLSITPTVEMGGDE